MSPLRAGSVSVVDKIPRNRRFILLEFGIVLLINFPVFSRRDSLPADFLSNFVAAIGGPEFATCLTYVEYSYLVGKR